MRVTIVSIPELIKETEEINYYNEIFNTKSKFIFKLNIIRIFR